MLVFRAHCSTRAHMFSTLVVEEVGAQKTRTDVDHALSTKLADTTNFAPAHAYKVHARLDALNVSVCRLACAHEHRHGYKSTINLHS